MSAVNQQTEQGLTASEHFQLEVGAETLHGDVLGTPAQVQALFLHGAGQSDRQRQRALREELAQQHFGSAAFDFSGHGESSARQPASLQIRLQQARHAWQQLSRQHALHTVIGTSMSGEIALRLACTESRVKHVVLLVGAIYHGAAFTLPFGPAFSAVIRRPHSWRAAHTLDLITSYGGHLTIVRALDDTVIPHEIADLLAAAARQARSVHVLDLCGVDHRLSASMAQNATLRQQIAAAITAPLRHAQQEN